LTLLVKALLVEMDLTVRWADALAGSMQRPPGATLGRRKHEPSGYLAAAGTGTLTR
jgi:AI-2 transport protein TqsA